MFGLFNLFSKKNPSIDVTLEVSMPEYVYSPSEHVSEYVQPPPAKIPDNACCPYCWVIFDKPPTRKKKCTACGNYIYVRTSDDQVKMYCTDEQAQFRDRVFMVRRWSKEMESRWFPWLSDKEKEKSAQDDIYFVSLMVSKLWDITSVLLEKHEYLAAYIPQKLLHHFFEGREWYTWWFLKRAELCTELWEQNADKEYEKMLNS